MVNGKQKSYWFAACCWIAVVESPSTIAIHHMEIWAKFCYHYTRLSLLSLLSLLQWRTQENISGVQGYYRPRKGSGSGAEPPGHRRIFENLEKTFLRKWKHCIIFVYFSNKFPKPALNFCVFWRKTQFFWEFFSNIWQFINENSIKIEVLSMPGKVVAKSRAFGNNIIFLRQIFPVGGGGLNPTPRTAPHTPLNCLNLTVIISIRITD